MAGSSAHRMDTVEIPVGDFTFRARAAGPADGELVLLLHGFPQSSYEWRAQLAALGDAGYLAVAPDQRGYSPAARPEGVEHYRTEHLVADVLAIADWLGRHTFHLAGHDWGAAVAWQVGGRYPERLRTLNIVSVPHPAAFRKALHSGGDQKDRSSYIDVFRQEGKAEDLLLEDDAMRLRVMFTGSELASDAIGEYVALMQEPGAMTAALNWYRAADLTLVEGLGE